jgi:hypothetical protein
MHTQQRTHRTSLLRFMKPCPRCTVPARSQKTGWLGGVARCFYLLAFRSFARAVRPQEYAFDESTRSSVVLNAHDCDCLRVSVCTCVGATVCLRICEWMCVCVYVRVRV